MSAQTLNVDKNEIQKFSDLASRWWDPESEFKPLHEINPLRLDLVDQWAGLDNSRVVDVGCGGGLLAEAMAQRGARVTGIDLSEPALGVARLHALEHGVEVDYRLQSAEECAIEEPGQYDIVTCLEMLEHVPNPALTVRSCAAMVRPGGRVFFSTLNRNPKSWLFAIIGAEYVLRLLPRGTHEYRRFIRPSELTRWCRSAGLDVDHMTGMSYNPLTRRYRLGRDVSVNYVIGATRPLRA